MKLTDEQQAIIDHINNKTKNLMIRAYAGTGKTFTLSSIVDELRLRGKTNIMAVAFNTTIKGELGHRMNRSGEQQITIKTTYSAGLGILNQCFGFSKINVNENLKKVLIKEALLQNYSLFAGLDSKVRFKVIIQLLSLHNLVRLNNLKSDDTEAIWKLAMHHGLFELEQAYLYLIKIISDLSLAMFLGQDDFISRYNQKRWDMISEYAVKCQITNDAPLLIDFADMIYLPLHFDLHPNQKYSYLLVDEVQDLNMAQYNVIKRYLEPGGMFILVGDEHQAIYGFTGAGANMMKDIRKDLKAKVLPLSTSWRVPETVARLVRKTTKATDFKARPDAPDGILDCIYLDRLIEIIRPGDLVLCRRLAPLVETCIKLILAGKRTRMKKLNFLKSIQKVIQEIMETGDIRQELINGAIERYRLIKATEIKRHAKRCKKRVDEERIAKLNNDCDIVIACQAGFKAKNLSTLLEKITSVFVNTRNGGQYIECMTGHTAKGLEAKRIFVVDSENMMLSWDSQQVWQYKQEENLRYVIVTRAQEELYLVVNEDTRLEDAREMYTNIAQLEKIGDNSNV